MQFNQYQLYFFCQIPFCIPFIVYQQTNFTKIDIQQLFFSESSTIPIKKFSIYNLHQLQIQKNKYPQTPPSRFQSRWAVACLTTSLYFWTVLLYSSLFACPSFLFLCSPFFMFEFCKELLVHAHRTLGTLSVQDGPVLSFLESYPSLSMNFLGPLLLPGVYLVGSPSRSLKRTKSALLKSRLCPHVHCSQECL